MLYASHHKPITPLKWVSHHSEGQFILPYVHDRPGSKHSRHFKVPEPVPVGDSLQLVCVAINDGVQVEDILVNTQGS